MSHPLLSIFLNSVGSPAGASKCNQQTEESECLCVPYSMSKYSKYPIKSFSFMINCHAKLKKISYQKVTIIIPASAFCNSLSFLNPTEKKKKILCLQLFSCMSSAFCVDRIRT